MILRLGKMTHESETKIITHMAFMEIEKMLLDVWAMERTQIIDTI